jgi:hypothetical protein
MMDNDDGELSEASETFECAACGMFYPVVAGIHECPRCKKVYCSGCFEENGFCLACREEEQKKDLPLAP